MTARKTSRPKSRKPGAAALLSPAHLVERAAGELRRGAPVLIRSPKRNESVIAVAAEAVAGQGPELEATGLEDAQPHIVDALDLDDALCAETCRQCERACQQAATAGGATGP